MEQIKIQTVDFILASRSNEEAESQIILAIHKLEDHKVNKHLIVRFICKLIDQLELKKNLCKEKNKIFIIDYSLVLLKNLNYH